MRVLVVFLLVVSAGAGTADEFIHGGNVHFNRTAADTVVLMGPWGSGAACNGQFQDPGGQPAWNGWTSIDYTHPDPATHWQVSDYQAANLNDQGPDNLAAWCGDPSFPPCTAEDLAGGYGNSWRDALRWTGQVADPSQPCLVSLDAWLNQDTEEGYDYCFVTLVRPNQDPLDIWVSDGMLENHHLQLEFTCQPEEFSGPEADLVTLQIRFTSDGAWSDFDCLFPSHGALQIDDITVNLSGGAAGTFDDFQDGLGNWQPVEQTGVGDFARIWTYLNDADPCTNNYSPQVAFIDDGQVVPGTGGTTCLDWCYGPGGYIVNNTGGLAGPDYHLDNAVLSPVIPWPGDQYQGCVLEWDVYRHEELSADSPGIGDLWQVRSTVSSDPVAIELAGWQDRDSGIRAGGPDYLRQVQQVSDLLEPGRRFIQLQLGAWEWGWIIGYTGINGTPAPYFDNVRILAFTYYGPALSLNNVRAASDNFPASGTVDLDDLGSNSVRFDAIMDVAWNDDSPRIDPGDSIFCEIQAIRAGAELAGTPRLYYRLMPNPVFDPYRSSGLPNQGYVEGWRPLGPDGNPNLYGFAFDLPDTGFFFPGDVIHYFIAASDAIDGSDVQTNHVPEDTTGFGDFSGLGSYDPRFTVRALPTVRPSQAVPGDYETPGTLFWNRFAGRSSLSQWRQAFTGLGLEPGIDLDVYSSRYLENTLASRSTLEQLTHYRTLLFSSGSLGYDVLGIPDWDFPADDLTLLDQWLRLGDKSALLTGNHLADNLAGNGFLTDWLGLELEASDVRPLIGNQFAPLVLVEPGNPVITSVEAWNVLVVCAYYLGRFDAVTALTEATRLAEFATAAGQPGAYPYSAATLLEVPEFGASVISLPFDLMYVGDADPAKSPASPAARTLLLGDVLSYFGVPFTPEEVTGVPGAQQLTVTSYPNPFNPRTHIGFNLPRDGQVSLKVFNLRGELVATLLNEARQAGPGTVTWDGNDGQGAAVSSGLYFYELRAVGQVKIGKMTLLR